MSWSTDDCACDRSGARPIDSVNGGTAAGSREVGEVSGPLRSDDPSAAGDASWLDAFMRANDEGALPAAVDRAFESLGDVHGVRPGGGDHESIVVVRRSRPVS